jgi:hypothetical protein
MVEHGPTFMAAERNKALAADGIQTHVRGQPGFLLADGYGFTVTALLRSGPRLLSPTLPLHKRQRWRDWGGIPERLGFGGRQPRQLLYRRR